MVRIDASAGGRAWSAVDPALEVGDVQTLASWLERLDSGAPVSQSLYFTEPNLAFELQGQPPLVMLAQFDLEFLPEWSVTRGYGRREPLSIRFPIEDLELQGAAGSLRQQLSQVSKGPRKGHA